MSWLSRGERPSRKEDRCPECDGLGEWHVPSDGYENSKSGRCMGCGGYCTYEAYVRRHTSEVEERLKKLASRRDSTTKEIRFLKDPTKVQERIEKLAKERDQMTRDLSKRRRVLQSVLQAREDRKTDD